MLFCICAYGCNGSQPQKYTINVQTNMNSQCTIYGDGEYVEGTRCTLTVVPNDGYEFVEWSDGILFKQGNILAFLNYTSKRPKKHCFFKCIISTKLNLICYFL